VAKFLDAWGFITPFMKIVGITARCDRPQALSLASQIISYLGGRVEVLVETDTANCLGLEGTPVWQMKDRGAEFIITVGGDGTILRTIQSMPDPLPVLGVNMGEIGFLVAVSPERCFETLQEVLEGFEVVERSRLAVELNRQQLPPAVNEVVVITAHPAKILSYQVYIDSKKLERLRADGIIFATATGSTAYAMSAGGPVVDPRVDATVIVPLAPFKLSSRPWVVPGSSEIKVELTLPDKEAVVVVDGQYTQNIGLEDKLRLTRAKIPARFVKTGEDFYEKVKNKLK